MKRVSVLFGIVAGACLYLGAGCAGKPEAVSSDIPVIVPAVAAQPTRVKVEATPERAAMLEAAIAADDAAKTRALVEESPALVSVKDSVGATPLVTAAFKDNIEIARVLVTAGADANAQKPDGWSPLHFAVWKGNADMVRLLLDNGAKPDLPLPDGGTPLHAAVVQGRKEIVSLLIAAGADVNAKKKDGWTPLKFAAWKKHEDIAEMLRQKGAGE